MAFNPTQPRQRNGQFDEVARADAGQLGLADEPEPQAVYDVYADRVSEARARVKRANARLARAGIDDRFELAVEEYTEDVQVDGRLVSASRARLTLNRPAISYGGFEFVARIEQLDTGELLTTSAPGQSLDGWQATSMECEHCGTTRARTKVYAVRKDGKMTTVGGSCIEAYTGLRPSGLSALEWEGLDDLDDADDWRSDPHGEVAYATDDILAIAYVLTKDTGYRGAYSDRPTADDIAATLDPANGAERAAAASVWAQSEEVDTAALRAEALSALEGNDSEWATNVRALLRTQTVTARRRTLLASAMAAVHRNRERQQRTPWAKGFIGAPGDKVAGVRAKVVSVVEDEEYYGYTPRTVVKVTMQTADGHRVFWKTSGAGAGELERGDDVEFSATVKDTSTYNDVDSTRVLRAKVAKVAPPTRGTP